MIFLFLFTDPNLFREIDVESLKSNKTYQQVAKTFKKKIEKTEKDAEKVRDPPFDQIVGKNCSEQVVGQLKKVADLVQSMNMELERVVHDSNKLKAKVNKSCLKQIRNKLGTPKELKQSKSTADLDGINSGLNTLDLDPKSSTEIGQLLQSVREKYVKQILTVYEETYKSIQASQIASIQPVRFLMGRETVSDSYF